MAAQITTTTGRIRRGLDEDRWWWSDEVFQIHGMAPGEVVPTTDVLLLHVLPEDRPMVAHVLDDAVRSGVAFGVSYGMADLTGHRRTVVLSGSVDPRDRSVDGVLVDVTMVERRSVAQQVDEQLRRALDSHTAIDQLKGIWRAVHGVDEVAAFDALREISQHRNVGLRRLSERAVGWLSAQGGLGAHGARMLDEAIEHACRETRS